MKNLILTCLLAIAMFGCDNPFISSKNDCREGLMRDSILTYDSIIPVNSIAVIEFDGHYPSAYIINTRHEVKTDSILLYNSYKDCRDLNAYNPLDMMSEPIVYNIKLTNIGFYQIFVNDTLQKDKTIKVIL
jgi:hypothetical protein